MNPMPEFRPDAKQVEQLVRVRMQGVKQQQQQLYRQKQQLQQVHPLDVRVRPPSPCNFDRQLDRARHKNLPNFLVNQSEWRTVRCLHSNYNSSLSLGNTTVADISSSSNVSRSDKSSLASLQMRYINDCNISNVIGTSGISNNSSNNSGSKRSFSEGLIAKENFVIASINNTVVDGSFPDFADIEFSDSLNDKLIRTNSKVSSKKIRRIPWNDDEF